VPSNGIKGFPINQRLTLPAPRVATPAVITQVFSFTGSLQTFEVPDGVTSITMTASGAKGGGTSGGNGAVITGPIPVTPGETLNIYVGGSNGYNGGGSGGAGGGNPGGGASDVRQGGTALANRVIVAGGGGGHAGNGGSAGGAGGLPNGGHGVNTNTTGGRGGTTTAGGDGNCGDGSLGVGGSAGGCVYQGGGGAGLYGGSSGQTGGVATGGGGGSSLIPAGGSAVGATNTGNGSIQLVWTSA
jgi:hypothetical protein